MVLCPPLLMLPLGARRPQKPNLLPSLMDRGLMALHSVADRGCQAPKLKLGQKERSLSNPAEAVNWYYRRMVQAVGSLGYPASLLERPGESRGWSVCSGGVSQESLKQVNKFGDKSDRLVLGVQRAERTWSPEQKGRPGP